MFSVHVPHSLDDEAKLLVSAAAARLSGGPAPIQATVGVTLRGERWVAGGAPDDIYEIGSVTKAFTATLLSMMIEESSVRLDDAVVSFLPEVCLDERITLGQLATHTSGLPRVPKELLKDLDRKNPYARFDEGALLRCLDGIKLTAPPGKRHQYSNLGAALLGQVLARRAELPFEVLLEQRLCKPLELRDTTIQLTSSQGERLTPGHTARGKATPHWDLASFAPAGALKSTAHDLLDFIVAQLDEAHTMRTAFERARTPHHAARGFSMGLGWLLSPLGKTTTEVWHTGGTGGAASYVGFLADERIGVVVLVNRTLSLWDALIRNRVEHAGRKLLNQLHRLRARESALGSE
jgi:CubicO group peptidase (beta-lactamase class C family)